MENKYKSAQDVYVRQIMNDMENGAMAVSVEGKILYANRKMNDYFEQEELSGSHVQSIIMSCADPRNDAFWDSILDVVHNRSLHHQKKAAFFAPSGRQYSFHVTSSYLSPIIFSGETVRGIVITISDETQYEQLLRKKHDASLILISMVLLITMTAIISELHTFLKGSFPHDWIARFTEGSAAICMLIFLKYTSLTPDDFGIFPKKPLRELAEALAAAAVLLLGMMGVKLALMHMGSPLIVEGTAFLDWAAPGSYYVKYIFIVIFQELLSRCALQQSVNRILVGKHRLLLGTVVTTAVFMALHVQHGLVYMLGAGALNAVLSVFYNRHNSLLGTCIIHYSFGVLGIVTALVG